MLTYPPSLSKACADLNKHNKKNRYYKSPKVNYHKILIKGPGLIFFGELILRVGGRGLFSGGGGESGGELIIGGNLGFKRLHNKNSLKTQR